MSPLRVNYDNRSIPVVDPEILALEPAKYKFAREACSKTSKNQQQNNRV
jgi:hypothetical protein